ncbi:MAG: glycosyltransferase [Elusimicrobia bacterium]|nr:glycosyltransferase [Candidatus Obscuribacterium magneticum]
MTPPSVLIVHNRYAHPGGEERFVDQQIRLLRKKGHEVFLYTVDSALFAQESPLSKILIGLQTPFSLPHYWRLRKTIREKRPKIVHVHNVFPLLTPSITFAANHERVPVVQSLHNYRFLCANGLFLRPNGQICETCLHHTHFNGFWFRCYGRRPLGSMAMAATLALHRQLKTFQRRIDALIAPSQFLKEKLIAAGYPSDRIHHLPSGLESLPPRMQSPKPNIILYVGRLSPEKGLRTLLTAARHLPEWSFHIAGDGPLRTELEGFVRQNGMANVRFFGRLEYDKIPPLLQEATFLVLPSECYENLPMVMMEAWFYGLPVIASRLGGMAEAIKENMTGFLFDPGDAKSLIQLVQSLSLEKRQTMEPTIMSTFENNHQIDKFYLGLNNIYRTILR